MPENSSHERAQIKILLTGGGSGGHIYPLLSVAEKLHRIAEEENLNLSLIYIGPKDEYIEALAAVDINIKTIISAKLRRYFSMSNFIDAPKFLLGLIEAFFKIFFIMPDAIFSKGGTGALPVILAGWFYRIPIIVHESDVVPGFTNSVSGKFASRIAVSFQKTLEYFPITKTAFVGTPIREALLRDIPTQESAKETLGFDLQKPLTLILGGSQGSQRINEFIVTSLASIIKETQALHQTGLANYLETETLSRAALMREDSRGTNENEREKSQTPKSYFAIPYLGDEYKTAMAAADLVVSRAGSGVINEISAFGKPSILIPLTESANDHQRANAYEFSKTGAATVIEEKNLLPAIFTNEVRSILKNKDRAAQMSAAAKSLWKPDAAEAITREILRLAR